MKAELKAKWIAALRGGEYNQGTHRLRSLDGTRHCCLGVLCDILGKRDGWEEDSQSISSAEIRAAGIYVDGAASVNNPASALAMMNDDGKSFAEIADYIEANL